MNFLCYYNGNFLRENEISISCRDLAFTRGYAIFECFRTYGKEPFCLDKHLYRLKESAKDLMLSYPPINWHAVIQTLIEKNDTDDLVFRIYLSETESGENSLLIHVQKLQPVCGNEISVITWKTLRTFSHIKSTNYLAAMLAIKTAKKQNAEDAIYVDSEGFILEGTRANFFAEIDNVLCTPKKGILQGVTRDVVIDLATNHNISVQERKVHISEIPSMQGAFLTSTLREILPIVRIDEQTLAISKTTKFLQKVFEDVYIHKALTY